MKKAILLPAIMIIGSALYAQDLHFSQYMQTPSLVNPALTGASTVVRASVIYKDQWRSVTVPYKTYGASFEMKFKASNWEKADKFKTKTYKQSFSRMAGGLSFFRDKAGDGNMGSTQVNLSLATFVPVTKFSSLSVGLQASVVQKTVDVSKLVFPNQYSSTGYDPNMNSGENYAAQNFVYPDFSGGINWSYGYNSKAIGANTERRANIGIAMYHINQPKQMFLVNSAERLNAKYILHADALFGVRHTNVALVPSFIAAIQGTSLEMMEGFMVKYYFNDDSKYTGIIKRSAFGIGISYRNMDAAILSALLEYENYAVGISYDLNTSRLTRATTGRGGPEIFVRFVTPNPFLYQKSSVRFL
jgi:type IX secretion system PorP/SprF family membrane protein